MVYGFTGAAMPPPGYEKKIALALAGLDGERAVFVTGSQVGVDETAARLALNRFPRADHVQIVPGAPGGHGELLPGARFVKLPRGKGSRGGLPGTE